jgi:transcriptional regulator with XRE-family HTH domain
MLSMKNNIEVLRRAAGFTVQELADAAGMSRVYLSNLKKGSKPLNERVITRLARALNCEPFELVGGSSDDCHKIPVIGEVPGGELQEALQHAAEDFIYFETRKRNVFALRVRGTSVNRLIPDGGFAVVDADEADPARLINQLVVVTFDRGGMYESTCKVYRENPTRFEPFSTERHDTIFPGSDPWRILGRVFGSVNFLGDDCKLINSPRGNK